jgi:hypothetical protein
MKKVTVLILCITGFVFADWMKVLGTSESPLPPKKWVIATDSSFVFIRNETVGFIQEDTVVDFENFQRIKIPEEPVDYDTNNIGKPQIPYIRLLIAVPDSAEFDITVYESDPSLFEDYLLYPVPEIIFESDAGGHVYPVENFMCDVSFYSQDTLYPGTFYEIKSDGHWRDQRVLEVFLYPVQFNPHRHEMYFYHNLDIRIEYLGDIVENLHGLGPFEDLGEELLLNYSGDTTGTRGGSAPSVHYYTDLLNPGNIADYLIVTHEDFLYNPTAAQWIDDFAWWRANHNLFDVGVVKMQDIYAQFPDSSPDSAAVLHEFLKYAYDTWQAPHMTDGHFAYCLFIGDWDYVPICLKRGVSGYWSAYEGYFRDLTAGGFEDIMLGRWPVKAVTGHDIDNLVTIAEKTLNYEKYPTLGDWRRRGFLIAGCPRVDDPGQYWNYLNPNVDASVFYFTDINYDTFTVRCPDTATANIMFPDTVHKYLNCGEIITAFYGHGGYKNWGGVDGSHDYRDVSAETLANGAKLPVVLSYACCPGSFHWDHPCFDTVTSLPDSMRTCLGDAFLNNPDGGAVVFYGATAPIYLHNYTNEPTMRILHNQKWMIGKALVNSTPNTLNNCLCLLGDPALDIGDYTAYPGVPDLVAQPGLSFLQPHFYLTPNDSVPIKAKVWNIGSGTATNVDVDLGVKFPGGGSILLGDSTISELAPRDSAVLFAAWHPGEYYPDYYGEVGDFEFFVSLDPDLEIAETWEHNNEDVDVKKIALYPYAPGWPKEIYSAGRSFQPAIANLDGAGSVEIVCPSLGWINVFDKDGNPFANWPQYACQGEMSVPGVVLGDINNDGKIEVISVSGANAALNVIRAYQWNGDVLWTKWVSAGSYIIVTPPSLGKIANASSPYLDVVVVAHPRSGTGLLKVYVYSYNGVLLYEYESSEPVHGGISLPIQNSASISDINGDGKIEIIVSADDTVGQGFTSIFNKDGLMTTLDYGSGRMTPALAKLDNDNYPDVIIGGSDGIIRAYDAKEDMILWQTQTEGPINSSPAVGNINTLVGFAGNEIAFGNDSARIHAVDRVNGWDWYPWPLLTDNMVRTSPALAYIDDNPGLDIVMGAHDQYIYVLDYNTDAIVPYPLPVFGLPSSPLIGDIDGSGKSEIILSSSDGYLHVWNNISREALAYPRLEWPQFHHDYQRTGLYGWYERMFVIPKFKVSMQEFSMVTTVSCSLSTSLQTQITIYNSQGEPVKTLTNQQLSTGEHEFDWDGTDDNNNLLPNGAYIIELKTEQGIETIPVEINR